MTIRHAFRVNLFVSGASTYFHGLVADVEIEDEPQTLLDNETIISVAEAVAMVNA